MKVLARLGYAFVRMKVGPHIGCAVLVMVFGSAILGMLIRRKLPESHLSDESKGVVTLSISAKSSGQPSSPIGKTKSASSQSDDLTEPSSLPMRAEEADRRFDEGESVFDLGFDPAKARRPGLEIKRAHHRRPASTVPGAIRPLGRSPGNDSAGTDQELAYDRLEKQSQ